MSNLEAFKELGLSDKTIEALRAKGFVEPTEIQRLCIPLLLQENTEVIGQAQTGTGKTAAFALPIIESIDGGSRFPEALILCPTRELALQVADEIKSLKGEKKIEVLTVYGGASMETQLKALKKGVDVVVGTPGRVLDHIKRGTLKLEKLKFAVLDEADEMLDMGFIEDIESILSETPENKRMLMFSATMPKPVLSIAERFMHDYQLIRTEIKDTSSKNTHQIYFQVRESDKLEALSRIIDREVGFYGVIFCRTKLQCEEIANKLISRGYDAQALHGDLSQREREVILKRMREKRLSILVATDVASRGLDIQELTHVINYSIPEDPEIYIHRVGRTGRAGHEGTAITLITPREERRFNFIKKATSSEIVKEEVPTPEEVIDAKRRKILSDLKEKVKREPKEDYLAIAYAVLTEAKDPLKAFAALLNSIYKDELEVSQYKKITSASSDKAKSRREKIREKERKDGLVRLFVARGKRDGLNKKKLAEAICSEVKGVKDEDLQGIEIMENFSFLNVPSSLADKIINYYSSVGRSIISRAHTDEEREDAKIERSMKKKDNALTSRSRRRRERDYDDQPYGRDLRLDGSPKPSVNKKRKEKTKGKRKKK